MSRNEQPIIAVTLGDPAGIGPEVVSKALRDPRIGRMATWMLFGKSSSRKISPRKAGEISFAALNDAVFAVKSGICSALVTAPVSKSNLQSAGFRFPGQTEFLADAFGIRRTIMMMAAERLKVSLVTIHHPLKKIFPLLTTDRIVETVAITDGALRKDFRIRRPRIAVCGLNPHAGEGGIFGHEEKGIILPAIRRARTRGMKVSGPYPADSVFYEALDGKFDAVVSLYHDQGLAPFKTLFFRDGVNVTLGLPIIRTSPDHGCAFDIAGRGMADPTSMKEAMRLSITLLKNRNSSEVSS